MRKTIFITGATDGIGLATAKKLAALGHNLLLHGRNPEKLEEVESAITSLADGGHIESYVADLSILTNVKQLAAEVAERHAHIDVLINNAGVYNAPVDKTADGLDIRFAVNTIAPYLLTNRLLPLFDSTGRVVNLSSAAQSPVEPNALNGKSQLIPGLAYAQSKLAITMWSKALSYSVHNDGPAIIAINPGSMLGSKMVKEAYGVSGGDIQIGADILTRAALSDEFANASGKYFDNDSRQFALPHPHALDRDKVQELTGIIEAVIAKTLHEAR